jgi:tetratricopeptide (TPR) repeat protein
MHPRPSLPAAVRSSTFHATSSRSQNSEVGRVIPHAPVRRQSLFARQPLLSPPPERHLASAAPSSLTVPHLFKYTLSFLTAFLSLAVLARAQTVRWEPSTGSLGQGQTTELSLVFEGCEPTGPVQPPAVTGIDILRGGEMRNTTIINGRVSQNVTLMFAARPSVKQRITIPSFTVDTDKGRLTVAPASYDVVDATIGGSGRSLESVVTARFQAPREVWVGEVFPLTYDLSILRRYAHSLGGELQWTPAPLAIEEWSKPEQREAVIGGENHIVVSQATRALARTAGNITLNAGNQLVNVIKGTDMWGRPNLDQFAITSDRPAITVKALPAGAPASFAGAVGKFTLESKIVPTSANVGDPVTWTLTLTGAGNWPDLPGLPSREASKDFRVVQPQAKRTNKDGALFEASLVEDVVLIPTKPGVYSLGPVSFTFFDPAKGEYQTVTAPRTTITIAAAPSVGGATPSSRNADNSPNTSATNASQSPTAPSAKTLTPPAAPTAIPRDPLPGSADAPLPLSPRALLLAALAPLIPLLVFWFILALRRAKQTDPLRPQREARARLAATLAELRSAKDPARITALLQSWQRDTAALWPLPRAVPSAIDFNGDATLPPRTQPSTLNSQPPAPSASWSTLWLEAERCLYGANTPLPADWIARAEAALAARPVKAFSAFSVFLPRNLLPFAAALLIGLTFAPSSMRAQSVAKAAYDRSDFAAAEKSWREQLANTPTDWIAHHNLALALAQQSRWQEAAAHAATAFVQHPDDASVRWHLALTLDKAGYTPTTISSFINPSPLHSLARRLSPAEWQRVIIAASALAALALALALLRLHGARSRALKPAAWTFTAVALCALAAALLSLRLYSPTGDIRAALVWKQTTLRSIPTEADTAQKISPLAAGSVAIVDKTYLGWSRLAFTNGQTGWVRHEDLVRLWRTK